jgi:hypothetical protein
MTVPRTVYQLYKVEARADHWTQRKNLVVRKCLTGMPLGIRQRTISNSPDNSLLEQSERCRLLGCYAVWLL